MKTLEAFEIGKIYTAVEYYKPGNRTLFYTVTKRTAKFVTVVESRYETEHRLYVRIFQGVEELWAPKRRCASSSSGVTLKANRTPENYFADPKRKTA